MPGITIQKSDVDNAIGNITKILQMQMNEIVNINLWLASNGVTGLTALGYTSTDANTIISAFNDLGKLQQIYSGQTAQPTTYDFRTFIRQLWGLGDV